MFWDEKDEKSSLPDLPPLKANPGFPTREDEEEDEEIEEAHELPSFPDSANHKGFSQAAIKDAIDSEEVPEGERKFGTTEMEEWEPETKEPIAELPKEPTLAQERPLPTGRPPASQEGKDIFVKIDKFRTVRKTLNETQGKLEEIDDLLKKIREIKLREEQELTSWEKDITNTRARIQEVISSIFDKVE